MKLFTCNVTGEGGRDKKNAMVLKEICSDEEPNDGGRQLLMPGRDNVDKVLSSTLRSHSSPFKVGYPRVRNSPRTYAKRIFDRHGSQRAAASDLIRPSARAACPP